MQHFNRNETLREKERVEMKDKDSNYRKVVFKDTSADFEVLINSSVKTKETIKWRDGNEYPLFKIEISSASHPFFTGTDKILDSEGRVEKFKRRFNL